MKLGLLLFGNPLHPHCPANYSRANQVLEAEDDDSKDNVELSQKRADAVKAYLIEKGCKNNKIESKGYGSTKPVGENKTEEGRQHNRRVEVRFSK